MHPSFRHNAGMNTFRLGLLTSLPLFLFACTEPGETDDDTTPAPDDDTSPGDDDSAPPILSVPVSENYSFPGLQGEVHVLRTAGNIPHIYASNPSDLYFAKGFVTARDRFFEMELGRRLAEGKLTELLGDSALETDIESRTNGSLRVAEQVEAGLDEDGRERFIRYADGVNAYLDQVRQGLLPAPSEMEVLASLLGADSVADLLVDWTLSDVAGMGATVIYELSFATDDIDDQRSADALVHLYDGAPLGELREAGAWADLFDRVQPIWALASSYGPGLEGTLPESEARSRRPTALPPRPWRNPVEAGALERARTRFAAFTERLGHSRDEGFGSNTWASDASLSSDGLAYLAGDGHLPLSVPPLFYQVHLDDQLLGGGATSLAGLAIPGVPLLAVGTNGKVAWCQTQLSGDQTDWYREEITLSSAGAPEGTVFQGGSHPIVAVTETYEVADVPLLGSEGRTEVITRYQTEEGRPLVTLEGTSVEGPDAKVGKGQMVVNINGDWLIPGDVDSDGVITGISFDYTAFEASHTLEAVHRFGESNDVLEFWDAMAGLVGYSQNVIAADTSGNILHSGYQATPCRGYLPRDGAGLYSAPGGDPRYLLDGTLYPSFEVPIGEDGKVMEGQSDPSLCMVPHQEVAHAINPDRGYVATANNDPYGTSLDNDLLNDGWYMGGPWTAGHRAWRIETRLQEAAGTIDMEEMSAIQGDDQSAFGSTFTDVALDAIAQGRDAATHAETEGVEGRLAVLYEGHSALLEEVMVRFDAWGTAGYRAQSGVETFYNTVDEQEKTDAVATMIFNAWFPRFINAIFDDEGLPDVWRPWGLDGRMRALDRIVRGSVAGNPLGLASFDDTTQQSAFIDVLQTEEIETLAEVALGTLVDALDFLTGEEEDPGVGGFETDDMEQWLWGLRHWVHFDSIVGDFLGDDPLYAPLLETFSITPDVLPIADDIDSSDPRHNLPGFPRRGDNLGIDAGNSGTDTTSFDYGSGPVMRMVVALDPDGVRLRNILPGGQSGVTDSPYFADQAALWLANEALDVPLDPHGVASEAIGHEVISPE